MGCPPGGVKDPAGTASETVIVVPGRVSVARLSQVAAVAAENVKAIEARFRAATVRERFVRLS